MFSCGGGGGGGPRWQPDIHHTAPQQVRLAHASTDSSSGARLFSHLSAAELPSIIKLCDSGDASIILSSSTCTDILSFPSKQMENTSIVSAPVSLYCYEIIDEEKANSCWL